MFGSNVKIKFIDDFTEEEKKGRVLFGNYKCLEQNIYVAKKPSNVVINENELQISLYHEIVHFILSTGNYNREYEDEPLVEWIARCLVALKKQGFFNLKV